MVRRIQKKRNLKEFLIFLLKFNFLLIPFYAIIYFDIDFLPLQISFANFLAFFLKLLGYEASNSGFFLFIGKENYPIDISRDCIGWKSAYSLFALVFATKGQIKEKLKFLSIWVPFILFFNFLRVLIILLIGLNLSFSYMELVHTFFFQEVMIGIIILFWYLWLKKLKKGK